MDPPAEIVVYRDHANEWRWRAIAANHSDVVADSGEGYKNHGDCLAAATGLFPGIPIVPASDALR